MQRKTLLAASIATASLFAASSAMAFTGDQNLYLGIGTGFSSLENDREEVDNFIEGGVSDFDLDDDDNSWKAFVGYEFNRFFAAELFYADLGRTQLSGNNLGSTDLDSTAYGVNLVGQLPITDWFTLFAKAGIAEWETEVSGNLGGASAELQDNDGTDPVYGVGAQFNINAFMIRTEYERYDFDSDYQIDNFSASVGMRF